ncbi:MAG: GntR family transcriptional regulator [Verrucomicrobiota bacterium]|nr:GntR family transcriptional regulator [Verrucomicrobiota bacterium]
MKKFNSDSHIPLYEQLEHFLIGEIRKGIFKNGDPLPSINKLDKELHLGRVTIVQGMRNLVKKGFAISKHGKGYFVRMPKDEEMLGVVAPFHSGHVQIYTNLLTGLRNVKLRNAFLSSDENAKLFIHSVEELIHYRGLTNIIVVPPSTEEEKTLKTLKKYSSQFGVKFAVLDRDAKGLFFNIIQDRTEGTRLLLEKAKLAGSKKILIFVDYIRRFKKIYKYMKKDDFREMELIIKRHHTIEKDLKTITEIQPDTVFAVDDIHARRILNKSKLQFKLTGYNGTSDAFSINPIITTVNSNLAQVGEYAHQYFFENKFYESDIVLLKPFLMTGDTL